MTTQKMYTPDWVSKAIFYQIFPDRFAKSEKVTKPDRLEAWDSPPTVHGYKGGDLYGIIEKLDYLSDLGITALYFNPIFHSASNHRYHTYDYFQVDPMLGGNDALRALIDACHARGMKVVLDGVFNHDSRGFFQFHDVLENKEHSPYMDWFHINKFPLNAYTEHDIGYAAWWGMAALPKFNTTNPETREYLLSVAEYWLEFGIDGWRLDVPNEINDDVFWQEFRERCRAINPECYIVGEIWDDASHWLKGSQFDAVMNYEFTRAIFGFVGADSLNHEQVSKCGYVHIPTLNVEGFAEEIEKVLVKHRKEVTQVQLNLLGSHDTPRAYTILGEDYAALKMSYLFLFSYIGAPCVYYGDELGLKAKHDPENRQSMPWSIPSTWDNGLKGYIQQLIALRKENACLQVGEYKTLYARDGIYVFARMTEGSCVVGVLNSGHEAVGGLELPNTLPINGTFIDALDTGGNLSLNSTVLKLDAIAPRTGYLFKQTS